MIACTLVSGLRQQKTDTVCAYLPSSLMSGLLQQVLASLLQYLACSLTLGLLQPDRYPQYLCNSVVIVVIVNTPSAHYCYRSSIVVVGRISETSFDTAQSA